MLWLIRLHAMLLKHAYRYLHFKVILVQLDPDICDSLLEEPGWPQHQHQLQVPWKSPLDNTTAGMDYFSAILREPAYVNFLLFHTSTMFWKQILYFLLDKFVSKIRRSVTCGPQSLQKQNGSQSLQL